MRFVIRLFVIPALMALVVHWFLIPGLDFPGYMENDGIELTVLVCTIIITFCTQLHRLDVLDRLERIEGRVEQLERQDGK